MKDRHLSILLALDGGQGKSSRLHRYSDRAITPIGITFRGNSCQLT